MMVGATYRRYRFEQKTKPFVFQGNDFYCFSRFHIKASKTQVRLPTSQETAEAVFGPETVM